MVNQEIKMNEAECQRMRSRILNQKEESKSNQADAVQGSTSMREEGVRPHAATCYKRKKNLIQRVMVGMKADRWRFFLWISRPRRKKWYAVCYCIQPASSYVIQNASMILLCTSDEGWTQVLCTVCATFISFLIHWAVSSGSRIRQHIERMPRRAIANWSWRRSHYIVLGWLSARQFRRRGAAVTIRCVGHGTLPSALRRGDWCHGERGVCQGGWHQRRVISWNMRCVVVVQYEGCHRRPRCDARRHESSTYLPRRGDWSHHWPHYGQHMWTILVRQWNSINGRSADNY